MKMSKDSKHFLGACTKLPGLLGEGWFEELPTLAPKPWKYQPQNWLTWSLIRLIFPKRIVEGQ